MEYLGKVFAYLSPHFDKMGLNCDYSEIEMNESTELLVKTYKVLREMMLDYAYEPTTVEEEQLVQQIESNDDLR